MEDLFNFLETESKGSNFKAKLCDRGGYVTFSNSGRRGDIKYFQIGLDNILQTLNDILDNLHEFSKIQEYDERPWRDKGSQYFQDPVANANSTVQTKPLFSTLSKVIKWANYPKLNDIDTEKYIKLNPETLTQTITKLSEVAESFRPKAHKRTTGGIDIQNSLKTHSSEYTHAIKLAIQTKPFVLLAGISGTGKSRIVQELAFKSCPTNLQDDMSVNPGNYCMIEVKPNWHDSTELLGYYSNLNKRYEFKKFVKFLIKASLFPDVPFFVCLDEMNLAPVEQYFAEILSILESRKHSKDNKDLIVTHPIIEAQYFIDLGGITGSRNINDGTSFGRELTDRDIYMKLFGINPNHETSIDVKLHNRKNLVTQGLTLPSNVIIIGTVNMDDTTHHFSRKVIDRAMTIEMNGGNLADMYGGSKDLEYTKDTQEQKKWQNSFNQRYVNADEVLNEHETEAKEIVEKLPKRLEEINAALKGTPFEVSYRVLNELTIMVGVMLDDNHDNKSLDEIIDLAINNILLMKILPRIEGDREMFAMPKNAPNHKPDETRLDWLYNLAPDISAMAVKENADDSKTSDEDGDSQSNTDDVVSGTKGGNESKRQQTAKEKIREMIERLNDHDFTRYWP